MLNLRFVGANAPYNFVFKVQLPEGAIHVEYQRQGAGLNATITLPGTLTGSFAYKGKTTPLKPGVNRISAP